MLVQLVHCPVARFLVASVFLLLALGPRLATGAAGAEPAPVAEVAERDIADSDPAAAAKREAELLTGIRQLTFAGRRAGEGYFSRDGRQLVFQSEREADNPFFQIYLLDLVSGDTTRISPGFGKTTCAWIHPQQDKVLFSSTHEDVQARAKQLEEFRQREQGQERRYSWDYDENYEIYEFDRKTGEYTNLTRTRGYDAEGSWSPDGSLIAFASNRRGFGEGLTEDERKAFAHDPSYLCDIYVMSADGSNVRRLTTSAGYDGGPFFSADGRRICWRRFTPDGAQAEILTMNTDGSDVRQVTRMGAMSWAPFFHPSGEYLTFSTNRHGFANFELYLVDAAGKAEPVRVSYTAGFDGLPAFSPDGNRLSWTSNRTPSKQSQIFLAEWNHEQARQLLGLDQAAAGRAAASGSAREAATQASKQGRADFLPEDIVRHVDYLCRPELEGRLTGTEGERLATAYVAAYLDALGVQPAGDGGSWFQEFEFTSGVALGENNSLAFNGTKYTLQEDWVPVAFSRIGDVDASAITFAGYGITAPKDEGQDGYDSFVHLDVTDKWLLVFRYVPERVSPERRQHLSRHASLRYKAMTARDKGARGLIVVSGPNSMVKQQLVRLQFDGTLAGASIPVISITDQVAEKWLQAGGKSLKDLQDQLDSGEPMMGFELPGVKLATSIDIDQVKRVGRNVLGRLPAGKEPAGQMIVVGAHVDHLGKGASSSSLARDAERDAIHFGADDNASGVAAMLEIAEYLSDQKARGQLPQRRDILLAAWSGEELGLIGSTHFLKTFPRPAVSHAGESAAPGGAHGSPPAVTPVYPAIAACLNLDMVGRLDQRLILQGVGSSSRWRSEIESRNVPVGLPIVLQDDSYLPTDANAFFLRGVPILSAFTGSHSEYHTPRDTPGTLNYEGAARTAHLMGLIARSLATGESPPDYVPQAAPAAGQRRAGLRAYLGTIPDYVETDVKGLKLSGVAAGGPAAKAGVQAGDLIVELAGKKIDNIYDYTYAIEALKIGQPARIVLLRNGERLTLEITPASRE